jgi:rSAM/selenodomain-associated transferase 2
VESPPFSFVIPVLNEQDSIASLLQNLAQQYPECELVVVDGGSSDETVARALPLCSNLLTGPPGRASQMNLGARAASGCHIFFLHADTLPSSNLAQLSAVLATRPRWGFFRAQLSGEHWIYRVIESGMNLRSRITRVATGDQTLFVDRDLLAQTGGYADIPLMEDIEFCKRLRRLYSPTIISQPVVTSSRRWETRGVCRTVLQMWALRLAYMLGVSPQRLWQYYYGR